MKKTFDSFQPCLELREVIFLRTLPTHVHLVPALDIFLDPLSHKLHICMEYMDGNLYQLMKARDHKSLDGSSVKSILFQILAGLDHIHAHNFFHRDIKPENILVSTSAPHESGTSFRRYSSLVTPPSTPPVYAVKIADFGLARETHSQHPYTTYVSTRWYRAPEVLLRAGEYSAPVDIWAIGAMAVEIANLKPLFPGGNEVDQVWRVCEIMGSPGNWYDKAGNKVGGGDWRDGTRLAQKLGFSFPKVSYVNFQFPHHWFLTYLQMAPHSIETILRPPQWPVEFSDFVTWCLMWDPKNRPTSVQAMSHNYFADAVDPLRPKSSTTRLLGRKHSSIESKPQRESIESTAIPSKSSWFRKSLIGKDISPNVSLQTTKVQNVSPRPSPVHASTISEMTVSNKPRPFASKRATWTNGITPNVGAPMPILPTIRPISPFSDAVNAQAHSRLTGDITGQNSGSTTANGSKASKKIGRQLSVASNGNHYADYHRQEAERALNGNRDIISPTGGQKEGFFSHLRKRARRLSGRPQAPMSPNSDDIEASAGCGPWQSQRTSMAIDPSMMDAALKKNTNDLDRALQGARYVEASPSPSAPVSRKPSQTKVMSSATTLERHHSLSHEHISRPVETSNTAPGAPISSRTRRALHYTTNPTQRYETPDEEEELLDEALHNIQKAERGLNRRQPKTEDEPSRLAQGKDFVRQPLQPSTTNMASLNPYPTPSPSAKRNGVLFNDEIAAEPSMTENAKPARPKEDIGQRWPTPPYEENDWAASAAASIFAASSVFR